jgi:hypothetical protein
MMSTEASPYMLTVNVQLYVANLPYLLNELENMQVNRYQTVKWA